MTPQVVNASSDLDGMQEQNGAESIRCVAQNHTTLPEAMLRKAHMLHFGMNQLKQVVSDAELVDEANEPIHAMHLGLPYNQIKALDTQSQRCLRRFVNLRSLDLAFNNLVNLDGTLDALQSLQQSLAFLSLLGNPLALIDKYRHRVVGSLPQLKRLDGFQPSENPSHTHDLTNFPPPAAHINLHLSIPAVSARSVGTVLSVFLAYVVYHYLLIVYGRLFCLVFDVQPSLSAAAAADGAVDRNDIDPDSYSVLYQLRMISRLPDGAAPPEQPRSEEAPLNAAEQAQQQQQQYQMKKQAIRHQQQSKQQQYSKGQSGMIDCTMTLPISIAARNLLLKGIRLSLYRIAYLQGDDASPVHAEEVARSEDLPLTTLLDGISQTEVFTDPVHLKAVQPLHDDFGRFQPYDPSFAQDEQPVATISDVRATIETLGASTSQGEAATVSA